MRTAPSRDPFAVGEHDAATAVQLVKIFPYQSFFDDVALQNALADQPSNSGGIVCSKTEQIAGHGLALLSTSQTPIAVEFIGEQGRASGGAVVVKPGSTIRPIGLKFQGFRWGLPFGWLGGGLAQLVVIPALDASIDHGGQPEIVFHRARFRIGADGALPALVQNWPRRFPWPNAYRYTVSGSVPQRGHPVIAVVPTRTLLRLRVSSATEKTIRLIFRGVTEFDLLQDGTVDLASPIFHDVTFPAQVGGAAAAYPVAELPGWVSGLAAGEGGVWMSDLGDATLTAGYVDVVRYAVL